ncbi:MAG TPA: hypothetical protein VG496_01790, partial [Myxococcales bacterium]|nr:hypothetical protein [Myxococcales bacterium]
GIVLALSGAVRLRHRASPFAGARELVACAAASVLFWDLFELLNLRLHDWWYVGVPRTRSGGAAFSAICFATVLPAVRFALALVSPRIDAGVRVASSAPRATKPLFASFAASLLLVIAFPRVAFPLAWLLLWFLFEAELARRNDPDARLASPLQAWRAGDRRMTWRLLAIALPIGLSWEALNFGCERGWVYTVPHFESWKLFEMPLPGYLGYFPFLLECGAALALLDRALARLDSRRALVLLVAIGGFHWQADGLGRRSTTVSVAPRMTDAHIWSPAESAWLGRSGLETPLDVLRSGLEVPPRVRGVAELAQVAHLGVSSAERLVRAGLSGRSSLAAADAAQLWDALAQQQQPPPDPALVRLWVRAARNSR